MTRLLFDTTFLIDAERNGDDLDELIDDDDDIAIAAITVAELRVGALLAARRRKASRTAYVDDILDVIPVLDYDVEVASVHASAATTPPAEPAFGAFARPRIGDALRHRSGIPGERPFG